VSKVLARLHVRLRGPFSPYLVGANCLYRHPLGPINESKGKIPRQSRLSKPLIIMILEGDFAHNFIVGSARNNFRVQVCRLFIVAGQISRDLESDVPRRIVIGELLALVVRKSLAVFKAEKIAGQGCDP
jgi:hypothetical protein